MESQRYLRDFELEDFKQLAAIFFNEKCVKLLREYGIADYGEGVVIGRNLESGLLYVAIEGTDFCFVLGPYLGDMDVNLLYQSPLDGTECYTLEEFVTYVNSNNVDDLPQGTVHNGTEIFTAWEGK